MVYLYREFVFRESALREMHFRRHTWLSMKWLLRVLVGIAFNSGFELQLGCQFRLQCLLTTFSQPFTWLKQISASWHASWLVFSMSFKACTVMLSPFGSSNQSSTCSNAFKLSLMPLDTACSSLFFSVLPEIGAMESLVFLIVPISLLQAAFAFEGAMELSYERQR